MVTVQTGYQVETRQSSVREQLIGYFESRNVEKQTQRKQPKSVIVKFNVRRTLTHQDYIRIVYLRFGSLDRFDQVRATYTCIAKSLKFNHQTVRQAIIRFKERGNQIELRRRVNGTFRKQLVIDKKLEKYLLDTKTMQDWAGLTILQRCARIRLKFNKNINPNTLQYFYKKNGVRYKAVSYQLKSHNTFHNFSRYTYAKLLSGYISECQPIVYLDETSVHCWLRHNKTWQLKDHFTYIPLPQTRGSNVTIYGAIGNCLRKPVFALARSTNKKDFIAFLYEIRKRCVHEETVYLVLDNHSAHKSQDTLKVMQQLNLRPLFQPAYSPQFNSIERLWSFVKQNIKSMLLEQHQHNLTPEDFKSKVRQMLKQLSSRVIASCVLFNHQYLLHTLKTQLH